MLNRNQACLVALLLVACSIKPNRSTDAAAGARELPAEYPIVGLWENNAQGYTRVFVDLADCHMQVGRYPDTSADEGFAQESCSEADLNRGRQLFSREWYEQLKADALATAPGEGGAPSGMPLPPSAGEGGSVDDVAPLEGPPPYVHSAEEFYLLSMQPPAPWRAGSLVTETYYPPLRAFEQQSIDYFRSLHP